MSAAPKHSTVRKLADPRLWIGLASLVFVASMAIVSSGRTSPGQLSHVHGQLSQLAGESSCSQCHGGWFASMQASCLECHTFIEEQMEAGRGLHGVLGPKASNCASCHSEHHGGEFKLVGRHSFAKAGVPDPAAFDHNMVGFAMDGKHLELACTECHEHAEVNVLPEGAQRFVGLSQDCASCHEDPHKGAMARSCTECHTQTSFDQHVALGHERHLPLVGGHGDQSCRTCHAVDTAHALERGRTLSGTSRTCAQCHDSPHGHEFAHANAMALGMSFEKSCVACHGVEHTSFRDERLELTPAQHACSGFMLALPHEGVQCAQCHDPAAQSFAERYPGRTQNQCAACHADVHGGQFQTGPFAQVGCVACHGTERFEPHGFDLELHKRTALPLEHSHLQVDCETCHTRPHGDAPRTFRGTPSDCAGCHGDAHMGFFLSRTAAMEPVEHGDCARCHDASSFDAVPHESFDHTQWTGFPVAGAHEQEGCAACHERSPEPDDTGRRFGRVAEIFGLLEPLHGGSEVGQACALCHQDPHGGGFDEPTLPTTYQDREGCARCHGESSFRDMPHGFDHRLWTGFPLDGAHAALDCASCHGPLWPPDDSGRTWQRAKGSACADCHQDPHGGQFAKQGQVDCARCHQDCSSFERLTFDHDWDTRFPLDNTHRQLDCAACHKPKRIGSRDTIHYRPMGTDCTDCHGVQAGSLRRNQSPR